MIEEFLKNVTYSSSGKVSKKDVNRFLTFLCLSPYSKMISSDTISVKLPDYYKKILFKDLNFSWYYKANKRDENLYEIKLPKIVKHMVILDNKFIIRKKAFSYIKEPLINELFKVWKITSLRRIDKIQTFSNTSKKNWKQLAFQFIPLHPVYCKDVKFNSFEEKLILVFNKYIVFRPYLIEKMLKRKLKHRYKDVYWKINIRDEIHLYNSDREIFEMLRYPFNNIEPAEVR